MKRGQSGQLNLPTVLILMMVLALAGVARAQNNPALTQAIKTSTNASGNQSIIDAAVKSDVANLAANPTAAARNTLINGAQANPGAPASAAYLDVYVLSLNNYLKPLATDKRFAVRLNAAIVAAQVAQLANNARLEGAATAFINDKSDPVVLWGLRAAKSIIPNLLRVPPPAPSGLFSAIVNAVKSHNEGIASGWIATAAYEALQFDLNAPAARRATDAMITATIAPMQEVLAARIAHYKLGVPATPAAEQIATGYLSHPIALQIQAKNPAMQARTLQLISDLLSLASQQAAAPGVNDNDRRDLLHMIRLAGSAMSVHAPANSPLALASKLVMEVQPATPVDDVAKRVAGIHPAVIKVANGAKVTPPPKIEGHKPAPAPATAPTTLPGAAAPAPIPPPPPVQELPTTPAPGAGGPGAGGTNRPTPPQKQ